MASRFISSGASWGLVSGSIPPRFPLGAPMAFDGGDPPLRAASLRSPALRSVSPPSPERTGCDPTPETLDRRAVATAPYHLDRTGKNSCRAPATIVDAAHCAPSMMIRQRNATLCDVPAARCQLSNTVRCSSDTTTGAAWLHMPWKVPAAAPIVNLFLRHYTRMSEFVGVQT